MAFTGAKTSVHDFSRLTSTSSSDNFDGMEDSSLGLCRLSGCNDDSSSPCCSLTANMRRADDVRASEMLSRMCFTFSAKNWQNVETSFFALSASS